jgi:hypothetical protein
MLRWTMLALVVTMGLLGCSKLGWERGQTDPDPSDDIAPEPTEPAQPLACDYCVGTAPATFTGPSNFWRGKLGLVPDCKEPTPLQGIEGFLVEPSDLIQFVRECRITPSDTCPTEGQVCAPIPDADYQTCIHRAGRVTCPAEYSIHQEAVRVEGGERSIFTLCCLSSPLPG